MTETNKDRNTNSLTHLQTCFHLLYEWFPMFPVMQAGSAVIKHRSLKAAFKAMLCIYKMQCHPPLSLLQSCSSFRLILLHQGRLGVGTVELQKRTLFPGYGLAMGGVKEGELKGLKCFAQALWTLMKMILVIATTQADEGGNTLVLLPACLLAGTAPPKSNCWP